jgi:hypothetical protein
MGTKPFLWHTIRHYPDFEQVREKVLANIIDRTSPSSADFLAAIPALRTQSEPCTQSVPSRIASFVA